MRRIISSFLWENHISVTRNILFVIISILLIFSGSFSNFPYNRPEPQSQSIVVQTMEIIYYIYLLAMLAIFQRSVFRDLDVCAFYNQHPINYRIYFFGKCFSILVLFLLVDLVSFVTNSFMEYYYGNSLGSFTANNYSSDFTDSTDTTDKRLTELANSLFISGLLLFICLFRPLHFALLICLIAAGFLASNDLPELINYIPLFSRNYLASLLWAPVLWMLGIFIFSWKMRSPALVTTNFSIFRSPWLKKLYVSKWLPLLITSACFSFAIYLNKPQETIFPLQTARKEFMRSLNQLKNRETLETQHFSFKFQVEDQWIAEELSQFADVEWRQVCAEFDIAFPNKTKINVFIKTSDEHTLGSTRGAFIVINSETINSQEDRNKALHGTFRHELTHVFINWLSNYRFVNSEDILAGFFHEGLAELVEHNWNTKEPILLKEASLQYKTYGEDLIELLPKVNRFGEYDYELNYSIGYVFWTEFLKIYGRERIKDFLIELGDDEDDEDDEDEHFEKIQFLFHKAAKADIDLYQILQTSQSTMSGIYENLDLQITSETQQLKSFKALGLERQGILIPYEFPNQSNIVCKYRSKDSMKIRQEILDIRNYAGKTAGFCDASTPNEDKLQLYIQFKDSLVFRSRWIDTPGLYFDAIQGY